MRGWGRAERVSSPFQAQDTAVPSGLLKHGQHVDLVHHHVQLMPGGQVRAGRELGLLVKCARPGWDGSESEIQKDHSLAQGYQICFFQEYPSSSSFFFSNRDDTGAFEAL